MERIADRAKVLLHNIITFWKGLRDDTYGGYYGYMSQELEVDKTAEKGCILNSRILWFFSEAAMLTGREDLRREADHAYEFLMEHCLDKENGGVFWSLTYDGQVLDSTKHTYNQAFAIYALSSYYRLTGKPEALDTAVTLFRRIEDTCRDEVGYLEAFTRDWQPESNEKLSENGVLADKTMNTLLHVFEGYSGLYLASSDPAVEKAMRFCLKIYAEKAYDPALKRQLVFFDTHYNSIIDLYSYGHDIESSWLIDWGARLLGDETMTANIEAIDEEMARAIYKTAYYNHSLANECERGKVDETRIWWVQAESVLGFVNLWLKCGEPAYRDAAADIFGFIEEKLVDKRPGSEWFWSLDANGNPIPGKPIVEPWKCPYHNGRMCMELIRKDPDIYV